MGLMDIVIDYLFGKLVPSTTVEDTSNYINSVNNPSYSEPVQQQSEDTSGEEEQTEEQVEEPQQVSDEWTDEDEEQLRREREQEEYDISEHEKPLDKAQSVDQIQLPNEPVDSNEDIAAHMNLFGNGVGQDIEELEEENLPKLDPKIQKEIENDVNERNYQANLDYMNQASDDYSGLADLVGRTAFSPDYFDPIQQANLDYMNQASDDSIDFINDVNKAIERIPSAYPEIKPEFEETNQRLNEEEGQRILENDSDSRNMFDRDRYLSDRDYYLANEEADRRAGLSTPSLEELWNGLQDAADQAVKSYSDVRNYVMEGAKNLGKNFSGAQQDFYNREANFANDQLKPYALSDDETKKKYEDYFAKRQQEEYDTMQHEVPLDQLSEYNRRNNTYSDQDFASGAMLAGAVTEDPTLMNQEEIARGGQLMSQGLGKAVNENIDDGKHITDRNFSSKEMSADEYRRYRDELGMGGRDDIEDGKVYDKIYEQQHYGFKPYIKDGIQAAQWYQQSQADRVNDIFNSFRNSRQYMADRPEIVTQDGQKLDLRDFDKNSEKYNRVVEDVIKDDNNGVITNTLRTQSGNEVTFNSDHDFDKSEIEEAAIYAARHPNSDGTYTFRLPGMSDDQGLVFNDIYELDDWARNRIQIPSQNSWNVHVKEFPDFTYTQSDGTQITLTPEEYSKVLDQVQNQQGIDWGRGNLGKDSQYRKDITEMFGSGDFSDMPATFWDLASGSLPYWTNPTAWPMALAGGSQALRGLDSSYSSDDGTRKRLAEDIRPDQYWANVLLTPTSPATERLAGLFGGTGGILGKPIMRELAKRNAPAVVRGGADVAGEGLEEIVAGLWEDAQQNGLSGWYGNPVLKKNPNTGEILIDPYTNKPVEEQDETGHVVRDLNTPIINRVGNFFTDGALENFAGGSVLALPFTAIKGLRGGYRLNPGRDTGYWDELHFNDFDNNYFGSYGTDFEDYMRRIGR